MQNLKEAENKDMQAIQVESTGKHLEKDYIWAKSWKLREIGWEAAMIV